MPLVVVRSHHFAARGPSRSGETALLAFMRMNVYIGRGRRRPLHVAAVGALPRALRARRACACSRWPRRRSSASASWPSCSGRASPTSRGTPRPCARRAAQRPERGDAHARSRAGRGRARPGGGRRAGERPGALRGGREPARASARCVRAREAAAREFFARPGKAAVRCAGDSRGAGRLPGRARAAPAAARGSRSTPARATGACSTCWRRSTSASSRSTARRRSWRARASGSRRAASPTSRSLEGELDCQGAAPRRSARREPTRSSPSRVLHHAPQPGKVVAQLASLCASGRRAAWSSTTRTTTTSRCATRPTSGSASSRRSSAACPRGGPRGRARHQDPLASAATVPTAPALAGDGRLEKNGPGRNGKAWPWLRTTR